MKKINTNFEKKSVETDTITWLEFPNAEATGEQMPRYENKK